MTRTPAPPSETPDLESIDVEEYLECYQVPDPVLYDNTSQDILLSGIFTLCGQWPMFTAQTNFDLDTGRAGNIEDLESDLEFSISYARALNLIYYNLSPVNEAQLFEIKTKEPSFRDCLSIAIETDYIIEAHAGAAACLTTNKGRLAYIRVERIDPYGWGSIEISFVTWKKIVRP